MKRSFRKAFTLIELLGVMVIIAVLIGLLLPAVQKVRESAARMKCKNNLVQIGLALHGYHDTFNFLPPGYISGVAAGGADLGPGWGWAAQLLPFIEQQNLHSQIRFSLDIADPSNAFPRVHRPKLFLCPSDDAPDTFLTPGNSVEVAHSNYVGLFGSNDMDIDPGAGNGLFFRNSRIRFADIKDGTSNTLAVGERSRTLSLATWTGSVTGATDSQALVLGHCGRHTPNHVPAHAEDFWSRHTNGVNFLFADGSVHTINNSIDPTTWAALGTRDGGEPFSLQD